MKRDRDKDRQIGLESLEKRQRHRQTDRFGTRLSFETDTGRREMLEKRQRDRLIGFVD